MDRNVFVLTAIVLSVAYGVNAYGLDSLGDRINAQVQQAVQPLNGLGERINQRVQQAVQPLNGMGDRINQRVQEELYPLNSGNYYRPAPVYTQDYGYNRRRPIDSYGNWLPYNSYGNSYNSFKGNDFGRWDTDNDDDDDSYDYNDPLDLGLDHLGEDIEKQVQESLEPVRAMEETLRMKSGVGGTTVITFSPRDQQFIMRNYVMYECVGIIENGQCSGSLERFTPHLDEDFCYIRSYSQINDQLCLSTGPVSFSNMNGRFQCRSLNKDVPYLLITVSGYNKLCQDVARNITYRYYAKENDPQHVHIPNSNSFVKCTNNQRGICEFKESNSFPSSSGNIQVSSSGNGVHTFQF